MSEIGYIGHIRQPPNKLNKKILILFLSAVIILPGLASAADLASMARGAAETALAVATGVVVVMWVVAGIMFLLAAGDPGKLGGAKTGLIAAVIGTAIVIIANGAIGFVGGIFHM
jgi:uncharacterized membrane protein (DUF485 family)